MAVLLTIVGVAAIAVLWAIAIYNGLVRKRALVSEGWSGIETQLKRRADLIPNLVETVKGYAGHERAALERVTELRARSMQGGTVAERSQTERALTAAIGNIMAVAESYPDLKANQNFLALQGDLAKVEDEIQLSRRYYNGTVRELNIMIQSFPSNLIAGPFGFKEGEFFEIDNEADRQVPKVSFNQQPA